MKDNTLLRAFFRAHQSSVMAHHIELILGLIDTKSNYEAIRFVLKACGNFLICPRRPQRLPPNTTCTVHVSYIKMIYHFMMRLH